MSLITPSRMRRFAPAGIISAVGDTTNLTELLRVIAIRDRKPAAARLSRTPSLVTASLARREEFFLPEPLGQL